MVKKQKLYQKLINNQQNVRFSDFVTIVTAFGLTRSRVTGSHHIYSHADLPQSIAIQPDHNNQAKPYQVRQFLRLVEKYNLKLNADS